MAKGRVNRRRVKKQGCVGKSSPSLSNPVNHGKEFGPYPSHEEEPLKDL